MQWWHRKWWQWHVVTATWAKIVSGKDHVEKEPFDEEDSSCDNKMFDITVTDDKAETDASGKDPKTVTTYTVNLKSAEVTLIHDKELFLHNEACEKDSQASLNSEKTP